MSPCAHPTHRRRSQNSIHGRKAECHREAVRHCALPARLGNLQSRLLTSSDTLGLQQCHLGRRKGVASRVLSCDEKSQIQTLNRTPPGKNFAGCSQGS